MAWPALDASTGQPVGADRRVLVDGELAERRRRGVEGVRAVAVGRPDRLPARVRHRLRLPHPGPQQPGRRGRRAHRGSGRQRRAAEPGERLHPDADPVDAGVRHGLLRRPQPDHHPGRRPGRPRSPRSRRSSTPSSNVSAPGSGGSTASERTGGEHAGHGSRHDRVSLAAETRGGVPAAGRCPTAVAGAPSGRPSEQQHLVLGLRRPVRARDGRVRHRPDRLEPRAQPVRGAQHGVADRVRRPAQLPGDALRPGVPPEPGHVRRLRRVHRSADVRLLARPRPARQPGSCSARRSSAPCSSCRWRAATSSPR